MSPVPEEITICVVCAWRETCQKKYSFSSSGGTKCPDYTRDLTLPKDNDKRPERNKQGA
ncbi:MAG: hypothetical protein ABSE95_05990 [Thermodesulfobacteriota bacterium]|jgi:hypothetical protein